jgi:hypothetical protein
MAMDEIVKLSEPMGKADGAILADIVETWEPERIKERCVTDSKTVSFCPPERLSSAYFWSEPFHLFKTPIPPSKSLLQIV